MNAHVTFVGSEGGNAFFSLPFIAIYALTFVTNKIINSDTKNWEKLRPVVGYVNTIVLHPWKVWPGSVWPRGGIYEGQKFLEVLNKKKNFNGQKQL